MKSHRVAGWYNLKGKKYRLLSCRCCSVQDFRDKYREKESKKEIREAMHTEPDHTTNAEVV